MAASSATFNFVGRSRKTYAVSAYLDDTAGHLVTFSVFGKAGATSETYWQPPEAVRLHDVVIAAATGQTHTQLLVNGAPTGDMLLNAIHLAAINTRPQLNLIFSPGYRIGAVQIA